MLWLLSTLVTSDSSRPHGPQYHRHVWPPLFPRVCSMSFEPVMVLNHLILCHPHILMPPLSPQIRVFSNGLALLIKWPKYWWFSLASVLHSGFIYFRIDWFDLLSVQGPLKCLLQHHNSNTSIIWCSGFFMVQLSHPYLTTGKTISLTTWVFVGKVMSLLFSVLSKFVITFLPRNKHLLI